MLASVRWYRRKDDCTRAKVHVNPMRDGLQVVLSEIKDLPHYFTIELTREEARELAAQLLKAAGP